MCVFLDVLLHFLFGYPLPLAIGTTVTAVVITAVSGTVAHWRMDNIDRRTAAVVSLSGALGAVLGSVLFIHLTRLTALLSVVVGAAFAYASVRMVVEGVKRRGGVTEGEDCIEDCIPGGSAAKGAIGLAIGVLAGLVGLGGGYALVPSFIYLLRAPVKLAVGTSLASFISMALVSGAFKLMTGDVDLAVALALGAGTALGAQLGARLVPRTPAWAIKLLFGLIFMYISAKFVLAGMS